MLYYTDLIAVVLDFFFLELFSSDQNIIVYNFIKGRDNFTWLLKKDK